MISFIVGRNFGHLNRCVATISKFREINDEPIKIYAFPHSFDWLQKNLPYAELKQIKWDTLQKDQERIFHSKLIVHDWRKDVTKLKENRNQDCIITGIYHSDLIVSNQDSPYIKNFKAITREVANQSTDIFFHMNLKEPNEIPDLSTYYVPIPLICRDITLEPKEVKKILDIPEEEPFILVHMGGGVGPKRYKYIEEWFMKINHMKTSYRLVIANQFENVPFPFHSNIIQAPLFYNGINLVNAADLVISKPGMGILMDCISTRTPLLALPADTDEREVKNVMLKELIGSDICLAYENFSSIDLTNRIEEMMKYSQNMIQSFQNVPTNGAEIAANAFSLLSGKYCQDLPELYREILELTPFKVY